MNKRDEMIFTSVTLITTIAAVFVSIIIWELFGWIGISLLVLYLGASALYSLNRLRGLPRETEFVPSADDETTLMFRQKYPH